MGVSDSGLLLQLLLLLPPLVGVLCISLSLDLYVYLCFFLSVFRFLSFSLVRSLVLFFAASHLLPRLLAR